MPDTALLWRRYLVAALLYATWAVAWTYPLVTVLGTKLPGEGIGDNATFVWNLWWMREALASPSHSFFFTDYLFAPFGADLTLHTHTALPALIGATLLSSLPAVAAQNVLILASLALNGFAAFALAFDRTRHMGASLLAGLVYGSSAYVSTHLLGHFNLVAAGGLPLCALWTGRALDRRSTAYAMAAAATLAGIGYTDYYYFLFAVGLVLFLAAWRLTPFAVRIAAPRWTWLRRRLLVLLLADAVLVAAIALTGGLTAAVSSLTISATTVHNPLAFGWCLFALWLVCRFPPTLVRAETGPHRTSQLALVAAVLGTAAAAVVPLALSGVRLWREGDYVAPEHFWRSGPPGIDAVTLLLGNPRHPLFGPAINDVYARLGIDRIEETAWLGIVPVVLLVLAIGQRRTSAEIRLWLGVGALFLLWALGPWLMVAGGNTGLMLPQNLASLLPVVGNARMPGRAFVVALLALSMLCALVASTRPRLQKPWTLTLLAAALLADNLAAPFPLANAEVSSVYRRLAALPDGIVCELPLGLHDGFGPVGAIDPRVMIAQSVHRHPILGGAISRIPRSLTTQYEEMPIVGSLLRLSGGRPASAADMAMTTEETGRRLTGANIRYVVLDRATAPEALVRFVTRQLPLRAIAADGGHELYEIATTN